MKRTQSQFHTRILSTKNLFCSQMQTTNAQFPAWLMVSGNDSCYNTEMEDKLSQVAESSCSQKHAKLDKAPKFSSTTGKFFFFFNSFQLNGHISGFHPQTQKLGTPFLMAELVCDEKEYSD